MYLKHYNLSLKPFEISPDPKFLWLGEKHKEVLAAMKTGILVHSFLHIALLIRAGQRCCRLHS